MQNKFCSMSNYEQTAVLLNDILIGTLMTGRQRLVQALKGKRMDKVRIKAEAKRVEGSAKKKGGDVTGDAKLKAKGAEKPAGKGKNALGSKKDTLFNTFST
jgi:uncharacterized protein YjbJ (UPF0337 family)